jgi:hypothetical protein
VLNLEQRQRWRELILSALYDRTGGDALNGLMPAEILEGVYRRLGYRVDEPPESEINKRVNDELGDASGPDVDREIRYLEEEALLRWEGNQIVLTHEGIRYVEERAGGGEAAAVLPAVVVREVEAFLTEVQRKRDDLGLAPDDELALEAAIRSAEAQIKSPKPNRGIVRAALLAIGSFARDAAAGAAGSALFVGVTQLLGRF